jgi:hypothetical protein
MKTELETLKEIFPDVSLDVLQRQLWAAQQKAEEYRNFLDSTKHNPYDYNICYPGYQGL